MKTNYAVIADISCDLSPEIRTRFGIDGYIRGNMSTPQLEDQEGRLDMTDAELDAFYVSLKSNKKGYKTSPLSADKMAEYYCTFLKEGKDILALSLIGKLSATYNLMLKAKDMALEQYPERKIIVVDTTRYSMGVGILTIKAAQLRGAGLSIEENAARLEELKKTVHQMGPIDDLFWVASKGRISHAKAVFGSIFGIKPLGDFGSDGMVEVLGKVSGYSKAYKATVAYIEKTIKNPKDEIIFVAHSGRRKQAQELAKLIEEKIKIKEVIVTNIHPFSGINAGPGLIVAYYFGTEITDLSFEKQVMGDILAKKL